MGRAFGKLAAQSGGQACACVGKGTDVCVNMSPELAARCTLPTAFPVPGEET